MQFCSGPPIHFSSGVDSRSIRDGEASARVEKQIAKALGVRPHQIWPSRWDAKGNRLPQAGASITMRAASAREPQKRNAA